MPDISKTATPYAQNLNINIIGAGMGGMGSALALASRGFKNIHVWESASALGEVGAGINVTPNLALILDRWGVLDTIKKEAVALQSASVINGINDETLTSVNFQYIEKEFKHPFYVVHRAALQRCLIEGAERTGVVKLHLGKFVQEYDVDKTQFRVSTSVVKQQQQKHQGEPITADSGQEWVTGDIILASDGVKSKARSALLKRSEEVDQVVDTGQAAYRILVHRDMINEDPELLPLFTGLHSYRWIGEKRHIIAYPISNHTIFNMSTAHPDRHFVSADTWTTSGSKQELLDTFHDFCPRVQKLLQLVPEGEVLEWKLRVHSPVNKWVDGHVALVGDACHPTLPHLAQGAAQAIEDAAVIGAVLSRIQSHDDINKALQVYQQLRKPRADWAVATAASNGKGLHLGAGDSKDARDKAFRAADHSGGENPDKAIDKLTQSVLYGYDCEREAESNYDLLFNQGAV